MKKILFYLLLIAGCYFYRSEIYTEYKIIVKDYNFPDEHHVQEYDYFDYVQKWLNDADKEDVFNITRKGVSTRININNKSFEASCGNPMYEASNYMVYSCKFSSKHNKTYNGRIFVMLTLFDGKSMAGSFFAPAKEKVNLNLNVKASNNLSCLEFSEENSSVQKWSSCKDFKVKFEKNYKN